MKILIVFYSASGNTKKVVRLIENQLTKLGHQVVVRNALTANTNEVEEAELVIIGTPVHGYILFGQRPSNEVRRFLEEQLPPNLNGKPVIGFATYLFFPAGALNAVKKAVESGNGKVLGLFAQRRTKKNALTAEIIECIKKYK